MPDAATILKESSATTADLTSVRLALAVVGDIEEMPVKSLHGDLTNQPATAAKGGARITLKGSDVDVKFVVFGGDLYAARPGHDWVDYGPAAEAYDPAAILNPDTGLANVLTSFIDPAVEGRETIGDQQTVRVTGEITAEAMNEVAPRLSFTKRMPCTAWIQETGDHQLVQLKLVPSTGDSIHMLFSNWNAPVTVDKPPVKPR